MFRQYSPVPVFLTISQYLTVSPGISDPDGAAELLSTDWFNGKITGKPHNSWENPWFPVDFPINQSIDTEVGMSIPVEFFPPFVQAAVEALQDGAARSLKFSRSLWIYPVNYGKIHHFQWNMSIFQA